MSNTSNTSEKKRRTTFFDWLIYGKGTVSEPWPTAENIGKKDLKHLNEQRNKIIKHIKSQNGNSR